MQNNNYVHIFYYLYDLQFSDALPHIWVPLQNTIRTLYTISASCGIYDEFKYEENNQIGFHTHYFFSIEWGKIQAIRRIAQRKTIEKKRKSKSVAFVIKII